MRYLFISFIIIFFTGCATKNGYTTKVYHTTYAKKPTEKIYSVNGILYRPMIFAPAGWTQTGIASWYGPNFHGKYTSNGEKYNMYAFTAAHKTLPMNTIVKVINLRNNKSVIVRINDRGPFVNNRIIDLSYAAGMKIGLNKTGIAPVKLIVLGEKGKSYIKGPKIQIGAFFKKYQAQNMANKYKKLGYNAVVLKRGIWYKVYIVGFKSISQAKSYKFQHKITGFVVGD